MASYNTSQFKNGLKVMIDGNPCTIIENETVKPGKGQAFNRVKLLDLINQRVLEKTFKSGDKVEGADVLDLTMQYLYSDGDVFYFMTEKTFEQYEASKKILADVVFFLSPQDNCQVTLWNNAVIAVTPPNHVILTVAETDPGVKGDTAGSGGKPATMVGGAVIRVPLFVNIGDQVKVDTRHKTYIARVT